MKKSLFYLLIIGQLLFATKLLSQPWPAMHVPKPISEQRIKNFSTGTRSKYNRLTTVNNRQDKKVVYSKNAIHELILKIPNVDTIGLRVYFARYDKVSQTEIPSTVEDKKVILIFSYGYLLTKYADAPYFFIDDKASNNPVIEITDTQAVNRWIKNYNLFCQDALRDGLITGDRDNDDPTEPGKKFDTKSIFYNLNDLIEATSTEENNQHVLNGLPISISAYQFSFSAHGPLGNGRRWRNRMQLDIDYMYKNNGIDTPFHLDDLDDAAERERQTAIKELVRYDTVKQKSLAPKGVKKLSRSQVKKILSIKSIDNGQLCPTNCPK